MCLGIPGRIIEITDAEKYLAVVDVSGVRRKVNVACIAETDALDDLIGAWVLLHVGFAMSVIDEAEAARTLEVLDELGEVQDELTAMREKCTAMKYADEFRDPVLARKVLNRIERTLDRIPMPEGRPLHIMEVCGGHTHSIFRYGLQKLVPDSIEFVHGPGCPVCVLPMGRVDDCVTLAEQPQVIFTTFGDAMRVPGSKGSLIEAKARGADVRMVYSPLDALELARRHPEREVVFFALGFETTMPSTALTLLQAAEEGVENFSMICQHITIIPTLKALLSDPQCLIDGFIGPGHVSMVIGNRGYGFIPDDYGKPFVVAGFEPLDLLQSLWMVLEQMAEGRASVENQYARVVPEDGNTAALRAMAEVYEDRESCDWRGLGAIDRSGVRIRAAYADFDAERKFGLVPADVADPAICQCGEVVRGQLKPHMCRAFGKECTPATPLGALMVSSEEGACAAYHQYGATDLVGTRNG